MASPRKAKPAAARTPRPLDERRAPVAPPGPCALVIFGGTGDLTHRLLTPALYNLKRSNLLPENFAIIGMGRSPLSDQAWRADLGKGLKKYVTSKSTGMNAGQVDAKTWKWLADRMTYVQGPFDKLETYKRLGRKLDAAAKQQDTRGNVLFYLATGPDLFLDIIQHLGKAKLTNEGGRGDQRKHWRRVVIEKPFGHDLASARVLNAEILKVLDEEQVFRIDHFLGKETVQNILAFRFANGLFEPIWHRDRIDHVQITVAETVGVEKRGTFYEKTGCLRDMVPNHVLQLVAMVAMEPPSSFDAEAVRSKKADLIASIRPVAPADAVRGQYASGTVLGEKAKAYRQEAEVASDSVTETYVAMRLDLETWRWSGVPFYLRTGKRLSRRTTEIGIRFKSAPISPFRDTAVDAFGPDWLVLLIQPDEGISLQFDVKRPGPRVALAPVRMDFRYKDWFRQEPQVGYETLIYDCMKGDATLFQRADMVEASWRVVDSLLHAWDADFPEAFPNYASGSAGPGAADALLGRDGRAWRPLEQILEPDHGDDADRT